MYRPHVQAQLYTAMYCLCLAHHMYMHRRHVCVPSNGFVLWFCVVLKSSVRNYFPQFTTHIHCTSYCKAHAMNKFHILLPRLNIFDRACAYCQFMLKQAGCHYIADIFKRWVMHRNVNVNLYNTFNDLLSVSLEKTQTLLYRKLTNIACWL